MWKWYHSEIVWMKVTMNMLTKYKHHMGPKASQGGWAGWAGSGLNVVPSGSRAPHRRDSVHCRRPRLKWDDSTYSTGLKFWLQPQDEGPSFWAARNFMSEERSSSVALYGVSSCFPFCTSCQNLRDSTFISLTSFKGFTAWETWRPPSHFSSQ